MKRISVILYTIIFALAAWTVSPPPTQAIGGCCADHGDICGCYCCDNTALAGNECAAAFADCVRSIDAGTDGEPLNVLGAESSKEPETTPEKTQNKNIPLLITAVATVAMLGGIAAFVYTKRGLKNREGLP